MKRKRKGGNDHHKEKKKDPRKPIVACSARKVTGAIWDFVSSPQGSNKYGCDDTGCHGTPRDRVTGRRPGVGCFPALDVSDGVSALVL